MQHWDRVLQRLGNAGQIPLVAALTACRIIASEDNVVGIEVPDLRDCAPLFRNQQQQIEQIAAMARPICGSEVTVRLLTAPGSSGQGRYRDAEEHPSVQKLRALFNAEILAFEPMSEAEWERYLSNLDQ